MEEGGEGKGGAFRCSIRGTPRAAMMEDVLDQVRGGVLPCERFV